MGRVMPPRALLLSGVAVGCLAACTPLQTIQGATKIGQIMMNPDMPIGPPKDQPSKATVAIYVEEDANKNAFGQAAPVDVWLFQLSDDTRLRTLDFATLSASPKDALGTSYVAHKEKQVEPGNSKVIDDWEIEEETSNIGVAVGYKDIDHINWRSLDAIRPKGETYKIVVAIRGRNVAIQTHR
ncbi:type VI secretion system lipoprotein TssJ [Methylobacterium radiotolerans]|uniref:type VI secretion system lipoprotein TssJ n=1 Tax=Methylobacterium radiotolerans TaxID=31998 RepID=UPI000D5F99D9|nr:MULTISPECIES: type VI secretion system lipoprotein TssJ [Methylobacterium]MDE3746470.1 type VI secretion system lipoprotein TssJ [Methylobacterium radiotolerans]PVY95788.1 type VI secretion system protein VasD [Methylobacterium organophilum]